MIVIGAGTAGLTAAFRLAQAGRDVTLYEASARVGGRMFTKRDFTPEGQFCELGGELVDTGHKELIALARELGLDVEPLASAPEPDSDLFDIGGKFYRARDFFDPVSGKGAFAPLIGRIAEDQAALLDADGEWTARARTLDGVSLKAYFDALRPLTEPWAIAALEVAYVGEYGLALERQSALNFVDLVGASREEEFQIFGDSDELFRIAGGSSSLPDALFAALSGRAAVKFEHRLAMVRTTEDGLALSFRTPSGVVDAASDRVVLALPFTTLREVEGIDTLGLSAAKLKSIRELGYGNNAKIMTATRGRPWRSADRRGFSFSGALYTDKAAQIIWETSRGQKGEGGILTNFLSLEPAEGPPAAAAAAFDTTIAALSEATAGALDTSRRAAMFWAASPFVKGSYAGPLVGQYTTLVDAAATPELDGRLYFAGEHTSARSIGYMNGAVESGERAAREVLAA